MPREYSKNVRECNVTPGATLTKVLKLITIKKLHTNPSFLFSPNLPPGYLPFPSSSLYETPPLHLLYPASCPLLRY